MAESFAGHFNIMPDWQESQNGTESKIGKCASCGCACFITNCLLSPLRDADEELRLEDSWVDFESQRALAAESSLPVVLTGTAAWFIRMDSDLEPISRISEHCREVGTVNKGEAAYEMVRPSDDGSVLVVHPGKHLFDLSEEPVALQPASSLGLAPLTPPAQRGDFVARQFEEPLVGDVRVAGLLVDETTWVAAQTTNRMTDLSIRHDHETASRQFPYAPRI